MLRTAFRLTRTMARTYTSSAAPSPIKLRNPELWQSAGFLNGEWTKGLAATTFPISNPGNGKEIGTLPDQGVEDVKLAVDNAHAAFASWGKTTEYERHAILMKLFKLLQENHEDLAQIITVENGKPIVDARGEVTYGTSFIEWFANEAIRNYGETVPSAIKGVQNIVIRQPIGVCGIITPWNFPHAMITRKLGAALAAGCTVVIKAPPETPYSVLAIVELARQAGIPAGVINVVLTEANVAAVGKEMCENPLIHKISFTGSTRVGKILMQQSSSTLKKMSMELGGNAPFIVFDDADLDKAVTGVVASKFRLSGQTCVCANRIFVQDSVYDAFASKLAVAVRAFKVGEGVGEGITHGPLIHAAAVAKVKRHVEDAKSKGARVLVGGEAMEVAGHFFQPTVLTDVTTCEIDDDETFGPLAPLYRFHTEEEVLERANAPRVGLAGYFFSESISRVARVSAALEVGMVGANTGVLSQASIPFGGVKESGFGREGSRHGMAEYQSMKLVAIGGI